MESYYYIVPKISELCALLQDDLSKNIFQARLWYDIEPSADTMVNLYCQSGYQSEAEIEALKNCKSMLLSLIQNKKKVFIYGGGVFGKELGTKLLKDNIGFYGFCDKRAEELKEVLDKPVVSPEYLFAHKTECYVMIAGGKYEKEIYDGLIENGFPLDHILPYFSSFGRLTSRMSKEQYFEFPQYFPKGTAFVDGGCYHGETSILFSKWVHGDYSKIYAFEPDKANLEIAKEAMEIAGVKRAELIPAAMSDRVSEMTFVSGLGGESRVIKNSQDSKLIRISDIKALEQAPSDRVQGVSLDEVVKERVGFIKLDIEGAEMDALSGAKNIIRNDRPLMAVCVYHRSGDVLEIMNFLHQIVPEYRFWLRHYSCMNWETVLYAAVIE